MRQRQVSAQMQVCCFGQRQELQRQRLELHPRSLTNQRQVWRRHQRLGQGFDQRLACWLPQTLMRECQMVVGTVPQTLLKIGQSLCYLLVQRRCCL